MRFLRLPKRSFVETMHPVEAKRMVLRGPFCSQRSERRQVRRQWGGKGGFPPHSNSFQNFTETIQHACTLDGAADLKASPLPPAPFGLAGVGLGAVLVDFGL